jgi:hypothetical protein
MNEAFELREAARIVFSVMHPYADFEAEERNEFPKYEMARKIAAAVLGFDRHAIAEFVTLDTRDLSFEVGFALKQAPAQLYVTARSKDRLAREAAINQLVERVLDRLKGLKLAREHRPGWSDSQGTHLMVPPKLER